MSEQISTTLSSYRIPIGLNKEINTNRDTYRTNVIVDKLLEDYKDLIDSNYTHWFAARFYDMPFDQIHRAASEARQEGRDPKRLFIHKVKQLSK